MKEHLDIENLYAATTSLAIYSEQSRWARLNNFLIVNSIFLVAWATVFASETAPHRSGILIVFCTIGIIFSAVWSLLGFASNKYVDSLHQLGERLEKLRENLEKEEALGPFNTIATLRLAVRKHGKLTSSYSIVTNVPKAFIVLYVVLVIFSL